MAEKYQQPEAQGYPLAPPTMPRSDEESARNYRAEGQHIKKKNRMKYCVSTAIFAVLIAAIVLAIVLIFFRVKTPRIRLDNVTAINNGNGTINFSARVLVRNRNFGRYKIDSSVGLVRARDSVVGLFAIPDVRVRARSTRRFYVVSDLNSINGTNSGSFPLTVAARVRGKVEFLRVFDRKRSADLRCTMTINLPNDIHNSSCD